MATLSEIGVVKSDGSIDIVNCKFDGNLIGAGQLLANRYNSSEKALELVNKGGTIKSVDDPTPIDKKRIDHHFKSRSEYENHIASKKDIKGDGSGVEYFYLYDGKWLVACLNNKYQLQSLKKVLGDPKADDPDAVIISGNTALMHKPIDINNTIKGTHNKFTPFKTACINAEKDEARGIKLFASICYMVNKSLLQLEDFYNTKAKKIPQVDRRYDVNVVNLTGPAIKVDLWGASYVIKANEPNDIEVTYFAPQHKTSLAKNSDIPSTSRSKEEDSKKSGGSKQTLSDVIQFNFDDESHSNVSDVSKYIESGDDAIANNYMAHLNDLSSRGTLILEKFILTYSEYKKHKKFATVLE